MKNRFGSDVPLQIGIQSPQTQVQIVASSGNLGLVDKTVHAGEYHAIGYDLQGMSQQQLEATKATLEASKAKLDAFQTSKDTAALQGLTKHDLTGAILQAGVQSYFAVNDTQDFIASRQAKNIVANRHLSFGTFSTRLQPNQRYGLTLSSKLAGMLMDIDQMRRQVVSHDNDFNSIIAFNAAQGPRQSANEHLIPEALFDNPNTPEKEAEAISAVKALQIAAQQGQKIYTITSDNLDQVLPQLAQKASVIEDVQNAVNAGKVVTISQSQISYKGWTGTGYVIVDPKTGAGAYLIGGGLDGGIAYFTGLLSGAYFSCALAGLFNQAILASLSSNPAGWVAYGAMILAMTMFLSSVLIVYKILLAQDKELAKCYIGGFLNGTLVGGVISASLKYVIFNVLASMGLNAWVDTNNLNLCPSYDPMANA